MFPTASALVYIPQLRLNTDHRFSNINISKCKPNFEGSSRLSHSTPIMVPSLAYSSKLNMDMRTDSFLQSRDFSALTLQLTLNVHKSPLYLFCYIYPRIHFIHSMTASILLPSPTSADSIRCSVPPLQSCVFIKHHNYFATKYKVGPYFPLAGLCRTVHCFMGESARLGSSPVFQFCPT